MVNVEYPISFWTNLNFANKGLRHRLQSDKNLTLIDRFPRVHYWRGASIHSFIRRTIGIGGRVVLDVSKKKGKFSSALLRFSPARPSAGKRRAQLDSQTRAREPTAAVSRKKKGKKTEKKLMKNSKNEENWRVR